MKKLFLVAALAAGLMGCASVSKVEAPQNPQQVVFQAKIAYTTALLVAVVYARLPLCKYAEAPCADGTVVEQLQQTDAVAVNALDVAEKAVRSLTVDKGVLTAVLSSAQAAVTAFATITATLNNSATGTIK